MKGNSVMCSPSAGANWSGWILEANRDSGESVRVVQQRSGSRPTPGRGGSQAARRRVPRKGTVLLRKRSWPANRATLHSALAQAMMALHEPTGEARRWMGETAKGRGRWTVQQGVRRGSSARLYRQAGGSAGEMETAGTLMGSGH
jgi:hypothetical protein